ncbi:hypothetical protein B484DRAFT_402982, partial [Ochromonadaceae sp. CCMP2298]
DWNTRDSRALEDDIKDVKRQKRELAEGRRIQWTDITASISPPVQAAVELEPTYKEVEANTDTLSLYLLLETVCNRSALDNSETYRTQLVEHTYVTGECIFSWFVIFDELVKNINRTGGNSFKDSDMVYRLRQNIPSETSERLLVSAHAHKAGEPEYPLYAWCKKSSRGNGRQNPKGNGKQNPRRGDASVAPGVNVKCPNCLKPHLLEYCFFDPESDYCYPDVKDAHYADIANGGPGRHVNRGNNPRNNTKSIANKAYNATMNEETLKEDASRDGNYMVTSGRINALTFCAGDEEEVDYSESPPHSAHDSPDAAEQGHTPLPDTDPVQEEEGEEMDVELDIPANNAEETPPDNNVVPAHLINIGGVGYTVAQLALIVSAQTGDRAKERVESDKRLKKAGWGTLMPSRSDTNPVLTSAPEPAPVPGTTTTSEEKRKQILSLLHPAAEGEPMAIPSVTHSEVRQETAPPSPAAEDGQTADSPAAVDAQPHHDSAEEGVHAEHQQAPVQTMFTTEHEDAILDKTQETIIQVRDELVEQQRQALQQWRQGGEMRPKSAHSSPNTDSHETAADAAPEAPPPDAAPAVPEVWVDRETGCRSRNPKDWYKIYMAVRRSRPDFHDPAKSIERRFPTGTPSSYKGQQEALTNTELVAYQRKMKKDGNTQALKDIKHWLGHRTIVRVNIGPELAQKQKEKEEEETAAYNAVIPKTKLPPGEGAVETDDRSDTSKHANNDSPATSPAHTPDAGSSDGSSSGTSNPLIPLIPSWLVHANLERLQRALEGDFRKHPDIHDDFSPGSPNDVILCGKGKNGKVSDMCMRKWTMANPWIHNKNYHFSFLDPSMWPAIWAHIPRIWLRDFYMTHNRRAVKHNLPAIWLAYYLSCPFSEDGKRRAPTKITDINQPAGVYPTTINLSDPTIKKRTFAAPDPSHVEPRAKRAKVDSVQLSSDDSSEEFEDPSKRKRKANTQSVRKDSRANDSKPDGKDSNTSDREPDSDDSVEFLKQIIAGLSPQKSDQTKSDEDSETDKPAKSGHSKMLRKFSSNNNITHNKRDSVIVRKAVLDTDMVSGLKCRQENNQ